MAGRNLREQGIPPDFQLFVFLENTVRATYHSGFPNLTCGVNLQQNHSIG